MSLVLAFSVSALYADNEIGIEGVHCGTRGNLWGTLLSEFVIPDYFPPENPLLRAFLVNPMFLDLGMCERGAFRPAHFGESCMMHDQCYGTLGADKDVCDEDMMQNWVDTCDDSYAGASGILCNLACKASAGILYTAMRFQIGDFCPSCDAFEASQKRAMR